MFFFFCFGGLIYRYFYGVNKGVVIFDVPLTGLMEDEVIKLWAAGQ